jgi:adenylosuccinate lyase
MNSHRLDAISPLDGRYAEDLKELSSLVSEGALTRLRIQVESSWLLHLHEMKEPLFNLRETEKCFLEQASRGEVSSEDISQVKTIEKKTNHDVKAVEYWLQQKLQSLGAASDVVSHVHFACTSEDINNTAYSLMLRGVRDQVILPQLKKLKAQIADLARSGASSAMMSRTHGQPASPTTMGKEMAVFSYRLGRQVKRLEGQVILGKFNGAVGNYNAHLSACPHINWREVSKSFIEERLGITLNPLTTQIENHDGLVEFFDILQLLNAILIDFARDMWGYISLGYFTQRTVASEVGSSTMPHKVNPIYFENAEGNLGVSNSLLSHFAQKLPVSRWQRDLSDSTVLRACGPALGHGVLAYKNLLRGLDRVSVNEAKMAQELEDCWELLAEPVQTVMRRYGVVDAYDRLKEATRGSSNVTKQMIHAAIECCSEIPADEKQRMRSWTPSTYLGCARELALEYVDA